MKYSPQRIIKTLYRRWILEPKGHGRPVSKEAFDREYASGNWDHFATWEELPRYLVLAGVVSHYYPRPSVLDIGCGDGRLAKIFQPYPFENYTGIDISAEGLKRARSLGLSNVEFCEGNFETWSTDRTFDAVIFNECVGYAADPGRTVARFAPFLRPGGRLFISQFRYGNWLPIWRRIGAVAREEEATTITSATGKAWDIKVMRPLDGATK